MTDDPELAADLAALREMVPRASAVITGGVAASQLLAELDKHLEMVGALVGELVRRDAVIREAVGDPEYELDWSDLVERCRKLRRAEAHRADLRSDLGEIARDLRLGLQHEALASVENWMRMLDEHSKGEAAR